MIEATGNSHYAYHQLFPFAGSITIVDSLAMHDRTQACRKTDRVDALSLAQALRCSYVAAVRVLEPEIRARREWLSPAKPWRNILPPCEARCLPDELSRREDRLAAIAKAKAEIKQRTAERDQQAQNDHEQKIADRRRREEESGQKPRSREPQPPKPEGPQIKDQVNLTDAESRIMPFSGGGFEQAFNAQTGVDMKRY